MRAAYLAHAAIVTILIDSKKVDVNAKDKVRVFSRLCVFSAI